MKETTINDVMSRSDISCDMHTDCWAEVAMVDNKGWIYCQHHGLDRRAGGVPCRKLRPHELRKLRRGEPLARY